MVLSNIKSRSQERGFTIVELLIVIVVIAILATITIVAYSGITSRANTTKAATNAANVQKVLEAFNADNGYYPYTMAGITGYNGSTRLPSSITVLRGPGGATAAVAFAATGTSPAGLANVLPQPLNNNTTSTVAGSGLSNVSYSALTAAATNSGGAILYMDFSTGVVSTTVIYVGNASAASTFIQPA